MNIEALEEIQDISRNEKKFYNLFEVKTVPGSDVEQIKKDFQKTDKWELLSNEISVPFVVTDGFDILISDSYKSHIDITKKSGVSWGDIGIEARLFNNGEVFLYDEKEAEEFMKEKTSQNLNALEIKKFLRDKILGFLNL